MKQLNRHTLFLLISVITLLSVSDVARASTDTFADVEFSGSLWLWTAILIGCITTGAVYRNARKIGGGVLQSVYNYFATGMGLVVLSFIAVALPEWTNPFIVARTHDVLIIFGFIMMAYGAQRMLAAAGLK